MNCPTCSNPVEDGVPACPECGFSLERLTPKFGAIPRYSIYVTDLTYGEALTLRQERRLERLLAFFEKRFPQSRFSIVFAKLLPGQAIHEYAFYLMNRCQFSPFSNKGGRNTSLLLLIDATTGDACLTGGYGLEPWINRQELEALLLKVKPHLLRQDFYKAAVECIEHSMHLLKQKSLQAIAA